MSFNALRNAITTKLQSVSNISTVKNYPAEPKRGSLPMATVTPSEAESDYETTVENQRTYGFVIRLFYETKQGGTSNAVDALEGLVDEVVDAFDGDPQLTDESLSMPAKYTMIQLVPTPSAWSYFEESNMIMAEIRIRALVSFDTS